MQDHIFFTPAYEVSPDILPSGGGFASLYELVNGESIPFNKSGPLGNPVGDFLGFERLNDTFLSSDPDLAVLKSYPPLWPHLEFVPTPVRVAP